MTTQATDQAQGLAIDTIRTLSMDAVEKAQSGHPGTPMALAPLGYALHARHMRHDPQAPGWWDRDRFVLSCGHASMLLYSCLHMSGYDVTIEDLKQFRQWESRTPGHPEYGYTEGVETTTGPLGQGIGNAVGMALTEKHLAALFNRPGHDIVDHWTYFICSDGDLMEGVSHETASFAGHFGLGKLIGFYDDNGITIDGRTELTFSDDTAKRFASYGWQVLHIADVNDVDAIDRAIAEAKGDPTRPTLVVTKTHIGWGSPHKQDTARAHGEPLGAEEIAAAKRAYDWPGTEPFFVPEAAAAHWQEQVAERARAHDAWRERWAAYETAHPGLAREFERRMNGDLPEGWEDALPEFTRENGTVASRSASGVVLNALAKVIPELVGGSADLTGSNNTAVKGADSFSAENPAGRYVHFGIREFGMGTVMNGMALHGGVLPFGGTFLVFSDYMRASIRLASFMRQRVIYVFTHDSIGLGEDGPTHQPIEQLAALRVIPDIVVIRPADAGETAEAWRAALLRDGPTALVLTRQKLGFIDRTTYAPASGVARGAYVLADPADGAKPTAVLMSSGSEVALVLAAQQKLAERGVAARAVSVPSLELFAEQDAAYRRSVLPEGVRRVAIEAAHPLPWYRLVGDDGVVLGLERFGASAPYETVYEELGLTVEKLVAAAVG